MDKRFARSATLFSIMFLVMLIFAVVAFFYGMDLGSKRVESKYAHLTEKKDDESTYTYQQQDLVSFYHTVFAPAREFQNEWQNALIKVSNHEVSNISSLFKELEGQANKKAIEAASFNLQHAALLGDAQESYVRSLKQFEKLANTIQKKGSSLNYNNLMQLLAEDTTYEVAVSQALKAQEAYYEAMFAWASSIDPDIPTNFNNSTAQSASTWNTFPLVIKNKIVATYLAEHNELVHFYPHDLVSNIDKFIESGQMTTLGLNDIQAVIELLISTNAVRSGDYHLSKNKLYSDEFLPQIPLFFTVVK